MRFLWTATLLAFLAAPPALAQPTQEEIQLTIRYSEFLAGSPLQSQERARVQRELEQDYQTNREIYRQSLEHTADSYRTLEQVQDPLKLGLYRQGLLGQYYAQKKSGQRSDTLDLIFQKVQPLAWDPNRQMLLTASDLNGILEYLDFLQRAQGGSPLSATEREGLKQQFVAGFSQLPDEEMGFVCSGSLIWKLVAAQWQQANQEQQARMNQQYSESLGQQGSSSEFSSARDYRKLSELMMRTHATSMNILEATSGSNNYWKVVDQYR